MNLIRRTSRRVQLCSGAACLLLLAPSLLPAQQPKLSRTLAAGSVPAHLAFSPDGRTLASAGAASDRKTGYLAEGPGEVKLWDVATGKNTATLKGHAGIGLGRGVQPRRQDPRLGRRTLWATRGPGRES